MEKMLPSIGWQDHPRWTTQILPTPAQVELLEQLLLGAIHINEKFKYQQATKFIVLQ